MSAGTGPPGNDERRPGRGGGGHVETGQADAGSLAELQAFAVEHVARVRGRCPQFESVYEAMYVALVLEHLRPLDPDRPWLRRRWQAPRGEATWSGGQIGLHLPAPRSAA